MTVLSRLRQPARLGLDIIRAVCRAIARALGTAARVLMAGGPGPTPRGLHQPIAVAARTGSPALVDQTIRRHIAAHGAEMAAEQATRALRQLGPGRAGRTLFAATLEALASTDRRAALAFGDAMIDAVGNRKTSLQLARMYIDAGGILRPLEIMRTHPGAQRATNIDHLRQKARLLEAGYPLSESAPRPQPASSRRVLYYLNQCLPYHSSGYGIRTHWLLRHLAASGYDVTGVARFGYPNDRYDFRGKATAPPSSTIEGVEYRFRPDPVGLRDGEEAYIARAARELMGQASDLRPALIHAASNYQVGLAGVAAARALGIPSIYEVRGLWHLTRTSKDPLYLDSDHYRMAERLEVQAAMSADRVLVITQAVLDLLAEAGVDRSKMSLVPNAVDVDEFTPRPRDRTLADELGLADKVVIGLVGTFKWYEGLDLLLEAAARMRTALGDRFRVLLVGDGPDSDHLVATRRRLRLEDVVVMTGRVPHDRVPAYYSLIDVAAYPRTAARVCQFVSPLKPLEAMAMEKAVVVSDVKAQAEMVEHEVTGLVHVAGDLDGLCQALTRLVTEPLLRADLAARARAWTVANRSWRQITRPVVEVYEDLLPARLA